MNPFVTIQTFRDVHELLILRGRLESEGIECFVPDERTLQMIPNFANALGGVKLQVRLKQIERANAILEDAGYTVLDDFKEIERPSLDINKSNFEVLSEKLQLRKLLIVLLIATIIIVALYFFIREVQLYS